MSSEAPLLQVRDLIVRFGRGAGGVTAARSVSFAVRRGEVVALVGESGSGKSTIGLSLLGLQRSGGAVSEGAVLLRRKSGATENLVTLSERRLAGIRGNDVAMIFQEPMSSLNPVRTVGHQVAEALTVHRAMPAQDARTETLRLLELLGIPDAARRAQSYPHQLSGGMRQRVMIAMALSGSPALLVADEPTTALDVTIQAQIVEHLRTLRERTGMAILFITHDLGLVSDIADRVIVLYAGQVVEEGPAAEVFANPLMPYTQALMRSRPRLGGERRRIEAIGGTVPNLAALPSGCSFHPRCPHAVPGRCDAVGPGLEDAGAGRAVRCVRWRELQEARP